MEWFGVRSLYKYSLEGKTKGPKPAKTGYFEERVVSFRAASAEKAMDKAENEARDYQDRYSNAYGETVVVSFMKCLDAYAMDGAPKEGREVYSMTEVTDAKQTDKQYVDRKFGKVLNEKAENALRGRYMCDAEG